MSPAIPLAKGTLGVRVRSLRSVAREVVELMLEPAGTTPLPHYEPGAHVDLHLPNGLLRQYSLIDDGPVNGCYRLGIGRAGESRGGSRYVHDTLRAGDVLQLGAPRNLFALSPEKTPCLFIAGGIGITPVLSMARRCAATGRRWHLLYCVPRRERAAFLDELATLHGGSVHLHIDDEAGGPVNVSAWVARLQPDEHLYCCGPSGLMKAVEAAAPPSSQKRLHFEWFTAPASESAPDADAAFEVVLRSSGRSVHVPADRSVLEALEDAGESVPFGCREGLCGSCITGVCAGEPDHRDMVLSDVERASNQHILICVSRARTPSLELDL